MNFTFSIEQTNHIPSSGLYLLDGILTQGEIANGALGRIEGMPKLVIVVKNVGLVNPPQENNRLSLSIEKPPCSIESLRGKVFVGD